jgi:hypothetical protein
MNRSKLIIESWLKSHGWKQFNGAWESERIPGLKFSALLAATVQIHTLFELFEENIFI